MLNRVLVLVTFASLIAAAAYADSGSTTVYRWTDEYGRVHYGSHPSADNAREIQTRSAPLSGDGAVDQATRQQQRQKALDAYQRDREIRQADRAKAAQAKQERAERCKKLQSHWRLLGLQRRLYTKQDGGEKHYLSEQERDAEKARTRQAIQRACGRAPDS